MGCDSAIDQDQLGLFYQAVTRADKYLLLTRPYLSPEGESWEASPFWEDTKNLFSDGYERITGEEYRFLSDAGSPAEILSWASYQGEFASDMEEILSERVLRILHGQTVLENRMDDDKVSLYNGDLSGELLPVVDTNAVYSASQLESYISCPYQYFLSRKLGLDAQQIPELGMDVAQRGSIMHRILERVFQEVVAPQDLDSLLQSLDEVAGEVLENAPEQYGFRPTPLWEQDQIEIKERLDKTITQLHEASMGWVPIAFEVPFGLRGSPPLEVEMDSGMIKLRGFIDRVDKDTDGNFRIIDYKLGSSKLSGKDLEEGRRIQLPVYGLAARDVLGYGEPVDGFYWAINQAKSGPLALKKFGFEEAVDIATRYISASVRGISQGYFRPVAPKGGCPEYCPASAWCWEFVPQGKW